MVLLAGLALAACSERDSATPPHGGAGTATPTEPSGSTDTTSIEEPAEADESAQTRAKARCHAAQRRAVNRSRIWLAVDEVASAPAGDSGAASRIMRREADHVTVSLQQACGELPTQARRYLEVVREQGATPMGDVELDLMLDAQLRWAATVGREAYVQDTIDLLRECRVYEKDMTVTHRVLWAWTDTGKRWWIELTFDNRTGDRASGSTGGRTQVTGALPTDGYPPLTFWGGSGADQLFLRPGISRTQPLGPQGVQTTASGTLQVSDIWVSLGPPGRSAPVCELPVPHAD